MSGIVRFVKRVCVQTAVYWGSPTPDGYGGHSFANPVEIKVRWDDTIRKISDGMGEQIVSKAVIMTPEELQEKGMLFLGKLKDLSEDEKESPYMLDNAYMIKRVDKNPLYRSVDKFAHTVYL